MEKINSFDVFDTLLARRFVDNDVILNDIERRIGIKNFAEQRKSADNGSRSLLEIYQHLHQTGVISEEQINSLKELEISYEKETMFPIQENIDKVKDGDLLVSDMYISGSDILSLVRSVGLEKQVSIYQSNGDKRTGVFWDKAVNNNIPIDTHYGDNQISDVSMPKSRGFKAEHYTNSVILTKIEQYFKSSGLTSLCCLLREVRLRVNEPKHKQLFFVAGQLNLPWLLVACEMIYRKYKGKNLVFLSRDCQLLYKLYNAFYERCHYLPFSRKVALDQTEIAAKYLENQTLKDSVIIDISSTGRTWEKVCSVMPFNVSVLIYSDNFFYSKNKPTLPETFSWFTQNSVIGQSNEIIEFFNCGDHGYLDSIEEHQDIYLTKYGKTEMDKEIIDAVHKPIDVTVSLSDYHRNNIRNQLNSDVVSDENLTMLFKSLLMEICSQNFVRDSYSEFFASQEEYMKEVNNA